MALGVRDVLSEPVEVGDQELRFDYGLGLLNALNVALLRVLAHGDDGDDADEAWHLELEVGIVGDGHELGIPWPPENRVIGPQGT